MLFPPKIGGQGGAPGAIETIPTAWLSSYPFFHKTQFLIPDP